MLIFLSWLSFLGFVGNHILQDFGGEDASHLSRDDFDKLRSGEEEASVEVGTKSCLVHC